MRRFACILAIGLALAAPAGAQVVNAPSRLVDGKSFIVPDQEGYGVADCLKGGEGGCGRVVADAYCESQGFASAAHFGAVDPGDITGSVPRAAAAPPPRAYLVITCKE